jgi:hypothetical protein
LREVPDRVVVLAAVEWVDQAVVAVLAAVEWAEA